MTLAHMSAPDSAGIITVSALYFDGETYTPVAGSESRHTTHEGAVQAFNAIVVYGHTKPTTAAQGRLWGEVAA